MPPTLVRLPTQTTLLSFTMFDLQYSILSIILFILLHYRIVTALHSFALYQFTVILSQSIRIFHIVWLLSLIVQHCCQLHCAAVYLLQYHTAVNWCSGLQRLLGAAVKMEFKQHCILLQVSLHCISLQFSLHSNLYLDARHSLALKAELCRLR